MNDQHVKPEDLVADETFISWFRKSDPVHIRYWDDWIKKNGQWQSEIDKAVHLLNILELKDSGVSDRHTAAAKERLMNALSLDIKPVVPVIPMRRRYIGWASAASVIAVLVISLLYFNPGNRVKFSTEFGETKAIVLPDGSQVTLNANSSLRMTGDWKPGSDREVWLQGEGFFSIKHTPLHTRFVVHTNDINVEVLGTEFNLQQRRQHTTVVLHQGKVRLTEVNRTNAPPLIMNPGDLVEFNDRTRMMVRKSVNAEEYSAWKEGKMVFNNADFSEITQVIEENYGLHVNTGQVDLKGKAFNGIFPTNNLQVLLTALSKTYGIDIHVQNKEISLQPGNPPAQ